MIVSGVDGCFGVVCEVHLAAEKQHFPVFVIIAFEREQQGKHGPQNSVVVMPVAFK